MNTTKRDFKIKVDNREDKYFYMWDLDKFSNRVFMMRELLNEYFETGTIPDFSNKDNDPFWDPPEPVLIGTSYLSLKSLSYMIGVDGKINIMSTTSTSGNAQSGMLDATYTPVTYDGDEDIPEEYEVNEPEELLGKEIFFRVDVNGAQNLPADTSKDTYCTYIFKHEPDVVYSTEQFKGKNCNPAWKYSKQHRIEMLTDYHLDYFKTGSVSKKQP